MRIEKRAFAEGAEMIRKFFQSLLNTKAENCNQSSPSGIAGLHSGQVRSEVGT